MKKLFENWKKFINEGDQPLEKHQPKTGQRTRPKADVPGDAMSPLKPSAKMSRRIRDRKGKELDENEEGYGEWLADYGISRKQYAELLDERPPGKGSAEIESVKISREGIDAEWSDGVITSIYFSRRAPDYERD